MKILCISDHVEQMLHGPALKLYAGDTEAVISCGDLPFEYLEYIVTFLGVPLYYVLGNHDPGPDSGKFPGGCIPLDGRIEHARGEAEGDSGGEAGGLLLAGLSGSMWYSGGSNQYTERQMRRRARALSASIRWRKFLGRPAPDIFVTHSAPLGLGDRKDLCHTGFESFLPLIDRHNPRLWLHGHIHLLGVDEERVQRRGDTKVVNVFGHRILEV